MIKHNRSAFTLAEMMIVMLILTILLAAFAPLMTKKAKVDLSNPWRWANNNSDIYYGMGNNQTAMIGQNGKTPTDINSLLLLNAGERPALTVKNGDNIANLRLGSSAMCFGNQSSCQTESVAIGFNALSSASLANGLNTAVGAYALQKNESGYANTALGRYALKANTTGTNNVAIGYKAHEKNTTGSSNIVIGSDAAAGISSSGSSNIVIGNMAMYNLTSGSSNIAIGNKACENVKTGKNKVCIGNGSGPSSGNSYAGDESKVIYLGDSNTTVVIPGKLVVGKTAHVSSNIYVHGQTWLHFGVFNQDAEDGHYIPYADWSGFKAGTLFKLYPQTNQISAAREYAMRDDDNLINKYMSSDIRLKNIISKNSSGIEKIRKLSVYNYTFKKDEKKTPRVGVIAQDLLKIFPDAVKTGEDGYLMIRTEDMFYAAINAIKELDKIVQDLVAQVKTIATQVKEHDTQIKALQKENKELKNKVQTLEKQNKSFEARLKAIEKKL